MYFTSEAYVPSSDTYIEKDSSVNMTRLTSFASATPQLLERNDVLLSWLVSCIYGLGSPKEYADSVVSLRPGLEIFLDKLLWMTVDIQFDRNVILIQRVEDFVRVDMVDRFSASRVVNMPFE